MHANRMEDKSLYTESEFIYGIGKDLDIPEKTIKKSLENVGYFCENLEKIPYLKDHNLYNITIMAKNVGKLLLRNSKRLKKNFEVELVALISKATVKDLTPEELKKYNNNY